MGKHFVPPAQPAPAGSPSQTRARLEYAGTGKLAEPVVCGVQLFPVLPSWRWNEFCVLELLNP